MLGENMLGYLSHLGHYLFLAAHSLPPATLSEYCWVLGTDNVRGLKYSSQMEAIVCLLDEVFVISRIIKVEVGARDQW